jgi:hypothetical protein
VTVGFRAGGGVVYFVGRVVEIWNGRGGSCNGELRGKSVQTMKRPDRRDGYTLLVLPRALFTLLLLLAVDG